MKLVTTQELIAQHPSIEDTLKKYAYLPSKVLLDNILSVDMMVWLFQKVDQNFHVLNFGDSVIPHLILLVETDEVAVSFKLACG